MDNAGNATVAVNKLCKEYHRSLELLEQMLQSFNWVQDHNVLKGEVAAFLALNKP